MKRLVTIRLTPELFDEAKRLNPNISQAVEQALAVWIKRERQKAAKAKSLSTSSGCPDEVRSPALAARAEAGPHPMPRPPDAPVLGGKR